MWEVQRYWQVTIAVSSSHGPISRSLQQLQYREAGFEDGTPRKVKMRMEELMSPPQQETGSR